MARTTSSLPVPLSPVIRTLASVGPDGFDGVEDLAHRRALPDQVAGTRDFGDGFAQADIFFFRAPVGQRFFHQMRDFVRIERLADVVVGAVLQRCDRGFDRGIARHHDDDQIGIHLMQAALQFDAVGAAHLDVEQGQVPFVLGHARERVAGAFGGSDLVAFLAKPFSQRIADAQFVVDDQQLALCFHVRSPPAGGSGNFVGRERSGLLGILASQGRVTVKVVPRPGLGLHFDASVVALQNAAADGETEPDAASGLFGGEKWLERCGAGFPAEFRSRRRAHDAGTGSARGRSWS